MYDYSNANRDNKDFTWIEVNPKQCNKCGVCVDICPMDCLRHGEDGYPRLKYHDDCWYCDACAFLCPRQALTLTGMPYLLR